MENSKYKIKLLKLYEILKNNTDEEHHLNTYELIDLLQKEGVHCDRKILINDIAVLNENGYEVFVEKRKCCEYYVLDRSFQDAELKILLDAVNDASFITKKKTSELTEKIAAQAGSHQSEVLKRTIISENLIKSTNEELYYNVDKIVRALDEKKKIKFKYFDLTLTGAKSYRKDDFYIISPIDLIIRDHNYYVLEYSKSKDDVYIYRVDKMDSMEVLNDKAHVGNLSKINELRNKASSMFWGGNIETVEIKFDNKIRTNILDKFGFDFRVLESNDKYTIISAKTLVNDGFFGWCVTLGKMLSIIGPDDIVEKYHNLLKNIIDGTNLK